MSLPILLTPDGRRGIVADATPAIRAARVKSAQGTRFLALGFQQTDLSAAKGGTPNANGFRFRRGAMRSIARSGRGNPFITGHDWGDVRARGGTICDSYAEELTDGLSTGMYFEIDAVADWAIEGLENGTIDRFSIGADGVGEIMCTVHDVPVWSTPECWCWPGGTVAVFDKDGNKTELVAEWEYQDARLLELSGVNVPAVDGTYVVEIDQEDDGEEVQAAVRELALLCGRQRPRPPRRPQVAVSAAALVLDADRFLGRAATPSERVAAAALSGRGAPAAGASPQVDDRRLVAMTHEELCRRFGLPVTATAAELEAKMQQITAAAAQVPTLTEQLRANAPDIAERDRELAAERARAAQLETQLLAQHVDAELARLRQTRVVRDPVVASLRATATSSGRVAFDASLRLVEESAPAAAPPANGPRAALQSDAPASAAAANAAGDGSYYDRHKDSQVFANVMRLAGITAEQAKQHAPKAITVIPNLAEIEANNPSR